MAAARALAEHAAAASISATRLLPRLDNIVAAAAAVAGGAAGAYTPALTDRVRASTARRIKHARASAKAALAVPTQASKRERPQ
jgi:hypothetical protein